MYIRVDRFFPGYKKIAGPLSKVSFWSEKKFPEDWALYVKVSRSGGASEVQKNHYTEIPLTQMLKIG